MNIEPEDPKWTDYALGELEETERRALEAELAQSEEARQVVREIEELDRLLSLGLKDENCPTLTEEQRRQIVFAASRRSAFQPRFRKILLNVGLPVAASLLIVAALWIGIRKSSAPNHQGKLYPPAVPETSSLPQQAPAAPLKPQKSQLRDIEKMPRPKDIAGRKLTEDPQAEALLSIPEPAVVNGPLPTVPISPDEATSQNQFRLPPPSPAQVKGIGTMGSRAGGSVGLLGALSSHSFQKVLSKTRANSAVAGSRAERSLAVNGTQPIDWNTESYDHVVDNPFMSPTQNPLSTFSVDVDTASYSNLRRFLNGGSLPPKDAVRIEEMLNYFSYDYAGPEDNRPFSTHVEIAPAPWEPQHRLVRIGLKGRELPASKRPPSNLVFLIDVSGSMDEPNKLPLVKRGLQMLVQKLTDNDRVAIVVYAGNSGLVLPSTRCDQQKHILSVLEDLTPGGSTNGAEGIQLAYDIASKNFIPEGTNRVVLATDGDFNVGVTNSEELKGFVERERNKGIFLSVLGFGMGNYNDALMQALAQNGNGAAAYIDTIGEARKTLVDEASSTLFPIAKDVKIQVEFNPAAVAEYRLIGYETRMLNREDFDNDHVDAGDVGSGQTVTALYEIVPVGGPRAIPPATLRILRASRPFVHSRAQRIWLRQNPLQGAQFGPEPASHDTDQPCGRICPVRRRSAGGAVRSQRSRFRRAAKGRALWRIDEL